DRDLQVRRLYWGAGLGLLGLGQILCLVPFLGAAGGLFGLGFAALAVALMFLLAVLHHETDPAIQPHTLPVIRATGVEAAVLAFLFGNDIRGMQFLVPYGTLLALMGLVYLSAFASKEGTSSDLGYWAGLAVGGLGLLAFVLGLVRTAFVGSYLVP